MTTTPASSKKIVTFLAITLAFSAVFYGLIIAQGTLEAAGGLYVFGLMWSPGIAAIITQRIYKHSLREFGWKAGRFGYLALAFILPCLYAGAVYGITWLSGLGGFPDPQLMAAMQDRWGGITASPALQIALSIVLTSLLTLPSGMLSALGEEIGWRGLLVPELAKLTTFSRVSLISGLVWAAWHLPLVFFGDYNLAGAPQWYAALMFTIMVIGISFAFAWLRLRSGSLWTAVVLHASHNIFIQVIFTPLTVPTSLTPYIIDEFGAGLALAGLVVGWFFWQKSRTSPLPAEA